MEKVHTVTVLQKQYQDTSSKLSWRRNTLLQSYIDKCIQIYETERDCIIIILITITFPCNDGNF